MALSAGLGPLDVDALEPWQLASALGLAAPGAGLEVPGAQPSSAAPSGMKVPGMGIVPGAWSRPHSIEEGRAHRAREYAARVAAAKAAAAQAGP